MEALFVLLILVIVFAIVAVLGHGIWVFFAFVGRSLFGPGSSPDEAKRIEQREREIFYRRLRELYAAKQIDQVTLLNVLRASAYSFRTRPVAARADAAARSTTAPPATATSSTQTPAGPVPITPPPVPPSVVKLNDGATTNETPTAQPVEAIPVVPIVAEPVVFEPISAAAASTSTTPATSASIHPLDVVEPEPAVASVEEPSREPEPVTPSRPFTSLLASFMEERNIRWGEILSGILIVGSAIGLVISLWSTLRTAIPYFPALIFMGGTLAIYGAGMYTLKRWKLQTTSQGLLIIALLLIPLNFLAGIALSPAEAQWTEVQSTDLLFLTAVTVGLGVFGTVAFSASRALLSQTTWMLPVAVIGTSAAQVIVDRTADASSAPSTVGLLALVPVAAFIVALVGQLRRGSRWQWITPRRAVESLRFLGISMFALIIPLGLLAFKADGLHGTLTYMSPAMALAGISVLALGLLLQKGSLSATMAGYRTVATAIVVFSSLALGVTLLLAWPQPALLVALGTIMTAALAGIAIIGKQHKLHTAAGVCTAFTLLLLFHVFQGNLAWLSTSSRMLVETLMLAESGLVLMVLSVAVAGLAAWFFRNGQEATARAYALSTGCVAAASLLIALYSGFFAAVGDAMGATVVFGVYAAAALVAARSIWRVELSIAGSVLMLVTLVHALAFNWTTIDTLAAVGIEPSRPIVVAFLIHAVASGLLAVEAWRQTSLREHLAEPMALAALLTSGLCLPAAFYVTSGLFAWQAVYVGTISVVWLAMALLRRHATLFSAFQAIATVAVSFAVTAICQRQDWWSDTYFDPRHIQAQIAGLALWCLLFSALRQSLEQSVLLKRLTETTWPAVDRMLLQGLVVAIATLALLGCMPSVTQEFYASGQEAAPIGLLTAMSFEQFISLGFLVIGTIAALSIHAFASHRTLGLRPLAVTLGSFVILVISHLGPLSEGIWRTVGVTDPALASGVGSYLALALVGVALVAALREQTTTGSMASLFYLGSAVPLLVAASFSADLATASALRWSMALFAAAAAIVICCRQAIFKLAARYGFTAPAEQSAIMTETARTVVLIQAALPALALSLGLVIAAAVHGGLGGPAAGSVFDRMGPIVSYGGPLLILAAAWAAYAARERIAWFALAATLLVNLAVSCAQLIVAFTTGSSGGELLISLLTSNTIATAVCLMLRMAWQRREDLQGLSVAESESAETDRDLLGWTRVSTNRWSLGALAIVLAAQLGTMATSISLAIFVSPEQIAPVTACWNDVASYLALVMATIAGGFYCLRYRPRELARGAVVAALTLVSLVAVAIGENAPPQSYAAQHALLAGMGALATPLTFIACCQTRLLRSVPNHWRDGLVQADLPKVAHNGALALIGLMIVFSLRSWIGDLAGFPWSSASVGLAMVLTMALGVRTRSNALAYLSTGLAALTATSIWYPPLSASFTEMNFLHFVESNVIALALAGLFWLFVDRRRIGRGNLAGSGVRDEPTQHRFPAVYHLVATVGLFIAAFLILLLVPLEAIFSGGFDMAVADVGSLLMLATLAALLVATLWVPRARYNVAGLWILGYLTCFLGIDYIRESATGWLAETTRLSGVSLLEAFVMRLMIVTAAYVLLTSTLWHWRTSLFTLAYRLRVPEVPALVNRTWRWLAPANTVLATLVVAFSFVIVLDAEQASAIRLAAPLAVGLLVPALSMLTYEGRGRKMRLGTLLVATLAVVQAGWTQLPSVEADLFWLQHAIRATVALAAVAFAYGTVAVRAIRRDSVWFVPLRHAAVVVAGLTIGALGWSLGMETLHVAEAGWVLHGDVSLPFTDGEIAQVAIVLVGLALTLISIAVSRGTDPLGLSERGRMVYVYAAEIVLGLIFVHIRLTKPEWFQGLLLPYWPLIVMAIAFAGRLIGLFARRANLPVLAEPLERTGALLPLLPAIGYSLLGDGVQIGYSSTIFTVGFFYVVLAFVRRKPIYTAAAVLAGNATLWALFHEQSWQLFAHPQLWLIPPAVSALVAAQLNRHRLSEQQLTAVRYFAAAVIYVSSTGEMLMRGVDQTLWPVMIVMGLSVAGALLGIALRIRAYLYLGTSFLLLSIVSLVWHTAAALNEVWPWWAFGIALGIGLLVMFGVFEKKRDDVSLLVDGLRQWER